MDTNIWYIIGILSIKFYCNFTCLWISCFKVSTIRIKCYLFFIFKPFCIKSFICYYFLRYNFLYNINHSICSRFIPSCKSISFSCRIFYRFSCRIFWSIYSFYYRIVSIIISIYRISIFSTFKRECHCISLNFINVSCYIAISSSQFSIFSYNWRWIIISSCIIWMRSYPHWYPISVNWSDTMFYCYFQFTSWRYFYYVCLCI